jgi:hypothetical protein
MLRYSLILLLLWIGPASAAAARFQVGDILLQPLHCWVCSLIEAEEQSIYSHMGIVLATDPVVVGEAWGSVKVSGLADFMAKTEKGQRLLHLRLRDAHQQQQLAASQLLAIFQQKFEHLKYDPYFLWDNFDDLGREKLYCSEFITKLMEGVLPITLPLKRMHFNRNREHWERYFNGPVPDGQWGNSPADFYRSELFISLGEL